MPVCNALLRYYGSIRCGRYDCGTLALFTDLEQTKKLLVKRLKTDVPAVLLIRHAERYHIAKPDDTDVKLNEAGEKESCELGNYLKSTFPALKLESLESSPFDRCRKTAQNIGRPFPGGEVVNDTYELIGYPFAIKDHRLALKYMWELGIFTYVKHYLSGAPLEGHEPMEPALVKLVEFFDKSIGKEGLKVMVSHDFYAMVVLVHIFGLELSHENWPGFLDGILFYKENGKLMASYRETTVDVLEAVGPKKSERK